MRKRRWTKDDKEEEKMEEEETDGERKKSPKTKIAWELMAQENART